MIIQQTGLEIVIIDDNEELRKALGKTLSELGYRVSLTANGRVGLEIARVSHPNLIITDGQMPKRSGPEVARLLQTRGFSGKIIGISNCQKITRRFQARNVPVLQMPYRLAELIQLINELFPATQSQSLDSTSTKPVKQLRLSISNMEKGCCHSAVPT